MSPDPEEDAPPDEAAVADAPEAPQDAPTEDASQEGASPEDAPEAPDADDGTAEEPAGDAAEAPDAPDDAAEGDDASDADEAEAPEDGDDGDAPGEPTEEELEAVRDERLRERFINDVTSAVVPAGFPLPLKKAERFASGRTVEVDGVELSVTQVLHRIRGDSWRTGSDLRKALAQSWDDIKKDL